VAKEKPVNSAKINNNNSSLKNYYSVEEVAAFFSVSKPTIYRLIYDGEIQTIRIRRRRRISAQEIKRLEKYFEYDEFG